jgi:hypothetical protein
MNLLPAILEHCSSGRRVVFAGTDPGIVTTSTTIPKTLEEVLADINRYHVLSTGYDQVIAPMERRTSARKQAIEAKGDPMAVDPQPGDASLPKAVPEETAPEEEMVDEATEKTAPGEETVSEVKEAGLKDDPMAVDPDASSAVPEKAVPKEKKTVGKKKGTKPKDDPMAADPELSDAGSAEAVPKKAVPEGKKMTGEKKGTELTMAVDSIRKLPRPSRITAGLIESATFKRCHQKRRERRQARGVGMEIEQKKLAKERRESEIRTKRAYSKITAAERKYIRAHAQPSPNEPIPAVIHCFGHWQNMNNPIKGHSQRGTRKIRGQHRAHGHVGIVNEYNTSKVCSFCFSKVVLHKARRLIGGKEKVVRLNGAVECVHPWCPAKMANYTTRGRDANAAANIALSGASILLSPDHQPLPCFRRNPSNARYTLVSNFISRDTRTVHRDSTRKE